MQEDQFEKFVRDHREEFDTEIPSRKVWSGIEKSRYGVIRIRRRPSNLMKIAASLIIIAIVVFAITGNNKEEKLVSNEPEAYIPPEIVEMDQFYEVQVNEALEQLQLVSGMDSNLSQEVNSELQELEAEKMKLLEELQNDINNEQILEELIRTYRLRLEVLEDVLEIIRELNDSTETKHENYNGISL
jgi:hypothetical protein